jgi:hypothetical protein
LFCGGYSDGQVDGIRLTFTNVTACAYEAGDWSIAVAGSIGVTAVTGIQNTATCATDEYITLTITASANITGGATNPQITYANNGTAGSVAADGNVDGATFTATDAAAPVVVTKVYEDSDSNGTVDRLTLTISEEATTQTAVLGDFAYVANSITGSALASGTLSYPSTTTIRLVLGTAGNANITSHTTAPTLAYTDGGATAVADIAGNQLATFAASNLSDVAAPVVVSATFYDATSNDGKLDKITVVYSEALSAVSNGAADWAISSAANFSTLTEGSVICNSGAASSTQCIYNFTTATVKTSVGDLTLAYTAGTSSVTDGTNTAVPKTINSASSPAFTDGAAPVVASSTPTDGAVGVLRTTAMSLVFSEVVASLSTTISGGVTLTNGSLASETVSVSGNKIAGPNTWTISTAPDSTGNAFNRFLSSGTTSISFNVAPTSGTSSSVTSGGGSTSKTYTITVTKPSVAQEVSAGENLAIQWSTGGTGTIGAVNLAYSSNGGVSWTTIATNLPNSGSYSWTAPDIDETSVIIRAQGTDLATVLATDLSDAFSISSESSDEQDEDADTEEETDSDEDSEVSSSPVNSDAPIVTGNYFRGESWSTVYYLDPAGTRRPFLDSQTFFTYADDFSDVITIDDDFLSDFAIGKPMLPKAGVVLVKIQSVNSVYAMDGDGVLRWITSESVAKELYGNNWSDYVIDVPVTAWGSFTFGDDIESEDDLDVNRSNMVTRNALNSR